MAEGSNQDVIFITCRKCGKRYRVPGSAAGKRAKCTGCGEPIEVPAARPPEKPLLVQEPTPAQVQPSPYEQEAWRAQTSPGRPAANQAEAILRMKAAQRKQRTLIALFVIPIVLIVVVAALYLPSGPPDKGGTKPSTPTAVQSPETTKFIADLASTDNSVRSSAAVKLSEKLDQAAYAVPALKQALEKEENPEVRVEIGKALEKLSSK